MSLVSVVSPCRNERAHIDDFIVAVLAQRCDGFELELLIADGASDDGSRACIEAWAERDARVRLVDNSRRIVSTGLNEAIERARGDIIVRMDVHTWYADDYVLRCVQALQRTGATCVGGPWLARGEGAMQRAIAAAFQSRFGSGGAASRRADYSGEVDTVYLGAWRREDLRRLGGFDETLVRNQDDELALRIVRCGGRVWQSSDIRSAYLPRASLMALARQFHQYGYWKIPVIRKHRLPASARHVAPFGFLTLLACLAVALQWWQPAAYALAGLLLAYVGVAAAAAWQAMPETHRRLWPLAMAALACMHFGYASGFGRGVWDFIVLRRAGAPAAMVKLTR